MNTKARKANPARQPAVRSIDWPRADPVALAAFDPATRACTINYGPHGLDPRSREEWKLLCDDCVPYQCRHRGHSLDRTEAWSKVQARE
ncbi:hypothetical protein OKW09_005314 [Pseudomonas rhodesiae]|nr:hypothetical protein [Pseudomonas rhodesiae]MDF9772946.1 hypothetical protein [Pseudomonas rhodesiae]